MKRLLYKFSKILSEGKGRQLLWLSALIIVVIVILILFLSKFMEHQCKDVIALFFGVDSLSSAKDGEVLIKLFVYILGTLLFSTFLISVITNIFDNISSSFKEGRLEVNPKRFTLFLGSNHMLTGMLREMAKPEFLKKLNGPIVILTTRNIEELREVLFSTFASKEYKKLRDRLILIYGARDNVDSLKAVNAGGAEDVYILGEDNEDNHDGKSLASVDLLKRITTGNFKVRCKVFLEDPYSVHSQIIKTEKRSDKEHFCIDLINIYDDFAEKVLTGQDAPVIGLESNQHLHLVVSGYGRMSWAFVKTAFALLHFPNFDETTLKNRTTISIIDKRAGRFMKEFMSLYPNIHMLSNIRHEYVENGERKVKCSKPLEEYGDFLDVEWEFIEGDLRDLDIRKRLETWVQDGSQVLSIVICDMDEADNIGTALSLPRSLYETSRIFAFLPSGSGILDTFGDNVFRDKNTIITFGKESDGDVLFEKRSDMAKRVHYVYRAFHPYEKKNEKVVFKIIQDIDTEWYMLSEKYKLSNFYTAASIPVKARSFGFNQDESVDLQLSVEARELLDQVEHRRWVAADLLLGDYPLPIKLRGERKKDRFYHFDIAPCIKLNSFEKKKDSSSRRMIPYVVSIDNIDLLVAGLKEDVAELEARGDQEALEQAADYRTNIDMLHKLYPNSASQTK